MKKFNINIGQFLNEFNKEYDFLYEHCDRVAGYDEALQAGDDFLEKHGDFVGKFAKYRGDLITSDREVVAFMFALETMTNGNEVECYGIG